MTTEEILIRGIIFIAVVIILVLSVKKANRECRRLDRENQRR